MNLDTFFNNSLNWYNLLIDFVNPDLLHAGNLIWPQEIHSLRYRDINTLDNFTGLKSLDDLVNRDRNPAFCLIDGESVDIAANRNLDHLVDFVRHMNYSVNIDWPFNDFLNFHQTLK